MAKGYYRLSIAQHEGGDLAKALATLASGQSAVGKVAEREDLVKHAKRLTKLQAKRQGRSPSRGLTSGAIASAIAAGSAAEELYSRAASDADAAAESKQATADQISPRPSADDADPTAHSPGGWRLPPSHHNTTTSRPYETSLVIHPLYPYGDIGFLMGDRHFDSLRRVEVPGLPCILEV